MKQNELVELCSKIRKWVVVSSLALLLLEAGAGLYAGAAIGYDLSQDELRWETVASTVIFLCLIALHFWSNGIFQGEAIRSIELRNELGQSKTELVRRESLFKQLDDSIGRLNSAACNLSSIDEPEESAEFLRRELRSVLANLLTDPNSIFQCSAQKFTIVTRVMMIKQNPDGNHFEPTNVVLSDDLLLEDFFRSNNWSQDIFTNTSLTGLQRIIGDFMRKVQNENSYSIQHQPADDQYDRIPKNGLTLVGVPVPQICEGGYADGVLILFADSCIDCSNDLPSVLSSYGRFVANYLHSYSALFTSGEATTAGDSSSRP